MECRMEFGMKCRIEYVKLWLTKYSYVAIAQRILLKFFHAFVGVVTISVANLTCVKMFMYMSRLSNS